MDGSIWMAILGLAVGFIVGANYMKNKLIDQRIIIERMRASLEAQCEEMKRMEHRYGSADFVKHGVNKYGTGFVRMLDHLEIGGFRQ